MRLTSTRELEKLRVSSLGKIKSDRPFIAIGMGTCGIGNGADLLLAACEKETKAAGAKIRVKRTGCFGFCAEEPIALAYYPGKPILILSKLRERDAARMVKSLASEEGFSRLAEKALAKIESWDFRTSKVDFGRGFPKTPIWNEIPFFKGQEKLVLRDAGIINPEDIEEYIAVGGYSGLAKALESMSPDAVIETVKASKLRGRGGAGFSTGRKWELMRASPGSEKYVICNADEGDPGAYMNRNEIESDPHMLLEGMMIGAYAMGSSKGFVYVRAEYPLAVERLRMAVVQAKEYGLFGENILGSGFSFDLDLVEGAGAFVCGEETSLMASAEGRAGRAVPRPPFPAQKGYLGFPSTINNVETWCNVPVILANGPEYFAKIGTESSAGTKVFSLVGKVKNTGLVELPLGTTLDTIVYGMGEGTGSRKRIRAVQTGGPSGGCIPAKLFNTPVDYESLNSLGAIMGSGGMVVMDQDNCMVDVARYFVQFTADESCGKCAPCREGLSQCKRILDSISSGKGKKEDIAMLEALAKVIKDSALCGLGQTSANPILSTIRYFREEFEAHIKEKRCDAGVCDKLYLALCENSCPLHMNIPGYLQLLIEGKFEEAFELTLRDNPLPGTVGRICHFHCQMRCRRESVDDPVHQGEIHRYLADTMYKMGREKAVYERIASEKLPPTGKRIAVIGGGPAGLTAAFYLVRLGHEVLVYEEHAKPGGILRYGIPAYRLPKDVVDKEIAFIRKLGVKFLMNTRVGRDVSFDKVEKENDIVLLAFGAQEDMPLGIPGETLEGVLPGYHLLEDFSLKKVRRLGKHVAVVGAGNVAIDVARTALRLGSKVTVVYRRERQDMPANAAEIAGAEEEGIEFKFLVNPNAILDDGHGKVASLKLTKMAVGGIDESGRRRPVPTGKTEILACDTVVSAIGERVSAEMTNMAKVDSRRNGAVSADRFSLAASRKGVYAIGDAVSGPATVSEAMGMAKKAARAIDYELSGEDRFDALFRVFDYTDAVPPVPRGGEMNRAPKLPVSDRLRNFVEISLGYSGEQARLEAERCLRCDVKETCSDARPGGGKAPRRGIPAEKPSRKPGKENALAGT